MEDRGGNGEAVVGGRWSTWVLERQGDDIYDDIKK